MAFTLSYLESLFVDGTDVSPFECLTNGYMSIWKSRSEGNPLVLAQVYELSHECYGELDPGDFRGQWVWLDDAKTDLPECWAGLSDADRQSALSICGYTKDPVPSMNMDHHADVMELANLLCNLATDYVFGDDTFTAHNFREAILSLVD